MKIAILITAAFLLSSCNNHQTINSAVAAIQTDTVASKSAIEDDGDEDKKKDSLMTQTLDSLTRTWRYIKPTNASSYFEWQYSGQIAGKPACFNINLTAINIRSQKDIRIWAQLGDSLLEFYVGEGQLFGEPADDYPYMQICPQCKSPKLMFSKKKYLSDMSEHGLAFKFSSDSSAIEGFIFHTKEDKQPTHFLLRKSTPSFSLNYTAYRFHKHQKMDAGEVSEVPATVVLGVALPKENSVQYVDFLNNEEGGILDSAENDNFSNIAEAVGAYKKYFLKRKKESYRNNARSMIGGYDNTEQIYNQRNWLVLRTESFTGDVIAYAQKDMGTSYISYDLASHAFINEEDVMVNSWDDDENIEKLEKVFNNEYKLYGYAFVCPQGVGLRTPANHGWDANVYIASWQNILPYVKKSFIAAHKDWIMKN